MPAPIEDRRDRVLAVLAENSRPTLGDMVEATGMCRSTVKRTLRELERDGKLRRHPVLGEAPIYQVMT